MSYTLLTGSTGSIGSFLLRDALLKGTKLAVLARGEKGYQRVVRAIDVMNEFFGESLTVPKIIDGDLTRAQAGISSADQAWLAENCSKILHCAGVVKFQADGKSGEPYLTNVDGTRALIEVGRRCNVKEFHYVSTAYTCGDSTGPVSEDHHDVGQQFHNDYERSKFLAEGLLRQETCFERIAIYRPSVVLGDANTGFTLTFGGGYNLLALGWQLATQQVDADSLFRSVGLGSHDTINLVTADWVSKVILQLLDRPLTGVSCYHLTNPVGTSWHSLYQVLVDSVPSLSAPGGFALGQFDSEISEAYRPYFYRHPDFCDKHTRQQASEWICPRIDTNDLKRLCQFAVSKRFQSRHLQLDSLFSAIELNEPPSRAELSLEIADSGTTRLEFGQAAGKIWCSKAQSGQQTPNIFINQTAFWDLAKGRCSVEQLVYGGSMVLEGEPARFPEAMKALEQIQQWLVHSV